jgi:hypothetical protein
LVASLATSPVFAENLVRSHALVGFSGDNNPSGALWLDLGAQVDISRLALRYERSFPLWWATKDDYIISHGQLPEHTGERHTLTMGYVGTIPSGWLGAGGGWNWTTLDTLATDFDMRDIKTRAPDGTLEDRAGPGYFDGWIWKDRLRTSEPLFYLEAGWKWRALAFSPRLSFSPPGLRLSLNTQIVLDFL